MAVQRTGASRHAKWRCGRRRWLAPVADLGVGPFYENHTMSAVIKASGEQFDVDAFLAGCTLPVWTVYRRGERRFPGSQTNKDRQTASGVHVVASGADFDEFPKQVAEATEFLRAQAKELLRLRSFPGVQMVNIDFGVERRDVAIQCDYLSQELIGLAGSLGMGIAFSIFPGQWETSEAQHLSGIDRARMGVDHE